MLLSLLNNAKILSEIVNVFRETQILEQWHRKVVYSGFTTHSICRAEV